MVLIGLRWEEWVTASDWRVCIECAMLRGTVWLEGDGPRVPLHPSCRCDRVLLPDVVDEPVPTPPPWTPPAPSLPDWNLPPWGPTWDLPPWEPGRPDWAERDGRSLAPPPVPFEQLPPWSKLLYAPRYGRTYDAPASLLMSIGLFWAWYERDPPERRKPTPAPAARRR